MARARRTRFAASFVAVVAAGGCSHEPGAVSGPGSGGSASASGSDPGPGTGSAVGSGSGEPSSRWFVSRGSDGNCWARPEVHCPPPGPRQPTCNPPASMYVACEPVMSATNPTIISYDGTHCFLADGKTELACPS